MFRIDSHIPIPKTSPMMLNEAPWGILDVGQSFKVEGIALEDVEKACLKYAKKTKFTFICKEFGTGGVRVWRVQDTNNEVDIDKILNFIAMYPNITFGVLTNKMRSFSPYAIESAVEDLEREGKIRVKRRMHPKKNVVIKYYRLSSANEEM